MALSLNGVEPVGFKGKKCVPKINTELKMRLQNIKEYNEATDSILASAFPDDEEYVKAFLSSESTTLLEKEILHAYLMGGDTMVGAIMGQLGKAMEKEA